MNSKIEINSKTYNLIKNVILPQLYTNTPSEIHDFITENGVIAGGCIRDIIFSNIDNISDIDLFFKIESEKFLESKIPFLGPKSVNCINLHTSPKIQLITKYCGDSAENIISTFDINVCKLAFDIKKDSLIIDNDLYEIITNDIVGIISKDQKVDANYNNIKSLIRSIKILSKPHSKKFKLEINISSIIKEIRTYKVSEQELKTIIAEFINAINYDLDGNGDVNII